MDTIEISIGLAMLGIIVILLAATYDTKHPRKDNK